MGQEPDWDTLRATDPIEYSLQWTEWQRKAQKLAVAQQEQGRIAQLQKAQMQQTAAEHLERERDVLLNVLPDWKDGEKAKAEKAMILDQGRKLGFSEEELSQVYDHRAVLALRKAALYDQMMSKAAKAKPVQTQTVKPGAKARDAGDGAKKAQRRFAQTKSVRDAAAAIEFLLK
jgi:hypothetical protein